MRLCKIICLKNGKIKLISKKKNIDVITKSSLQINKKIICEN